MSCRTFFAQVALLTLAATALFGQATTSLRGRVTDPSGAIVQDARVSLTKTGTHAIRLATSDDSGLYRFPQVQPGDYELRVSGEGFTPIAIDNITLAVGQPATWDVQFTEIGQISEVISVKGSVSPPNTTDASLGNAFGERAVLQLPLNARNVINILSLQPGVTFIGDTNNLREDRRSGAINGGRSDQSNITLDGVDVNDQQSRFAFTSVLRSTLDSVQEFRVTTLNADASQGRSSGAQVQLVTKSGTNNLHGSAYEYHRNTKTASNDFFNNQSGVARPSLIRNIFGGSAGGAIKQNRAFFFVNSEIRRDASEGSAVRAVPSDLMRQGTLQYLRADGSLATLNSNDIRRIDPTGAGASPVALDIFNTLYPAANDNTVGDGLNVRGHRFTYPVRDARETYIAKLDFNLDDAGMHRLFVRGQMQSDSRDLEPQFSGRAPNGSIFDNSKGLSVGYDQVLTPRFFGSTRYGFTRQGVEQTGIQTGSVFQFRGLADPLGLTQGLARTLPAHLIRQDMTWLKGSHTVRFGGVYRHVQNRRFDSNDSFHRASANSSWMEGTAGELLPADISEDFGVAFADAMVATLGLAPFGEARYRYDVNGGVLPQGAPVFRNFGNEEAELYVMDQWQAARGLTITAGVRWSLMPPVNERNGVQTSPNIPLAQWLGHRALLADQGLSQADAGVIEWDLSSRTGRGLYPYHKKNLAPRVSLAYSPQSTGGLAGKLFGGPGKTVIRAGTGMYYDVFGQSMMERFSSSALGFSTRIANPAGTFNATTAPRITSVFGAPESLIEPAPAGGFPQVQPDSFQITNTIDDSVVPPYSMALNFSIGRDLGNGFFFESSYVGRLSRRSLVQSDLAMPTNLRDPESGQTYFEAAGQLASHAAAGTAVDQVAPIAFWENMWPAATGASLFGTEGVSATQAIYELYSLFAPDYTFGLNFADTRCLPACSRLGPNAIFNSQYSALAAWRSLANGNYHSGQFTLRKRFSDGVQFDLNYTVGKSIDLGSFPENASLFGGGFVINSWDPGQMRAVSDYDMTHQLNANYVAELPFGRGKRWGANWNPAANAILGGWQISGIYRHTSGLPARVGNGRQWPTNWNHTGFATPIRNLPTETGAFKNAPAVTGDGGPNIFANPQLALDSFAPTRPGQSGVRNPIRGDGFFTVDLGLAKGFEMPWEGHRIQFRWEVYNVTNSTRFDPALETNAAATSISLDLTNSGTFGKYSGTLTNPRVMQFALRYEF